MHEDFITIGTIIKPIGLRGEVKISPLTDFPERFAELQEVIVQAKGGEKHRCRVERVRYGPPFVYITFSGFSSLESVVFLIGGSIQIPAAERVSLPEGSYYHFEIEGLAVYLEGGAFLGRVDRIFQTGSNDVYVVKEGDREYLIPALSSVVKEISLAENRMTIRPMEGLLEL